MKDRRLLSSQEGDAVYDQFSLFSHIGIITASYSFLTYARIRTLKTSWDQSKRCSTVPRWPQCTVRYLMALLHLAAHFLLVSISK
ncbi:hypothetical protein E2C01_090711 [Portunus trituberculatus]|uniref:Uncharacterized protein n=1 Tax=Portunus trituberculatus TaxID=210409 RepID=A0A5B7JMH3_PORTR|nr:hypothetical protein [Portunus trituberculatus]